LPSKRFKGVQVKRFYRVLILGMQDQVLNKILSKIVREIVKVNKVLADKIKKLKLNNL